MRKSLAALPLLALAACGGNGVETVGGAAVGSGSGSGSGSGTVVTQAHFLDIATSKVFDAIGSFHEYNYKTASNRTSQYGQLYAGNAGTVRSPTATVTYDPRDAIFTLKITDPASGISEETRFQDPAHRIAFGGSTTPQWGVPDLAGVNYLEIGSDSGTVNRGSNTVAPSGIPDASYMGATFFYQRPGGNTKYVTYAGYVRNEINFATVTPPSNIAFQEDSWELQRGAFVFGDQTARGQVPLTGTGSYTGSFLASMVNNPTLDDPDYQSTYFQWISGTSAIGVNFANSTVTLSLTGKTGAPYIDHGTTGAFTVPANADFAASGTATIDLTHTGGFTGEFQSASLTYGGSTKAIDFARISTPSSTAGASSIDGAFYGPDAVNVGGGFRIVGGIPDQRVDILGAFTGGK